MASVFHRKDLHYDKSLNSVLQLLLNFWTAQSQNFPVGKTVLLKPNLLSPHPPQSSVTTHPFVLRLVSEVLKEFGNRLIIADSPAGINNKNIPRLWEITGMTEIAANMNAELIDIDRRGLIEKRGLIRNFFFTDLIDEVDYIVNLPKLKTHGLTLITGAIKNVYGLIPGIQKGEYHVRYPKSLEFSRNIVDIFAAVKPDFTVMDGITILEGNGPSSGGRIRRLGLLIAGSDAVAVDSAAAHCMGILPNSVEMIRYAAENGLGSADMQKISVIGDKLEQKQVELPAPHAFSRLPGFVYPILKKMIWTRPKADKKRCTACDFCIGNCPADAMCAGRDGIPEIDYEKCINCFCCAEVCPENAIFQDTSRLVKLLS